MLVPAHMELFNYEKTSKIIEPTMKTVNNDNLTNLYPKNSKINNLKDLSLSSIDSLIKNNKNVEFINVLKVDKSKLLNCKQLSNSNIWKSNDVIKSNNLINKTPNLSKKNSSLITDVANVLNKSTMNNNKLIKLFSRQPSVFKSSLLQNMNYDSSITLINDTDSLYNYSSSIISNADTKSDLNDIINNMNSLLISNKNNDDYEVQEEIPEEVEFMVVKMKHNSFITANDSMKVDNNTKSLQKDVKQLVTDIASVYLKKEEQSTTFIESIQILESDTPMRKLLGYQAFESIEDNNSNKKDFLFVKMGKYVQDSIHGWIHKTLVVIISIL